MSEEHYSKRSFDAVLLESIDWDNPPMEPGLFLYVINGSGEKVGLQSCLPNARDQGASWGITMFKGHGYETREWTWDGNVQKPSLSPSIHRIGHWHGWLRDGRFVSV